jgi:hypothetical protein
MGTAWGATSALAEVVLPVSVRLSLLFGHCFSGTAFWSLPRAVGSLRALDPEVLCHSASRPRPTDRLAIRSASQYALPRNTLCMGPPLRGILSARL